MQRNPKIPTHKNPAFPSSKPINILLRKGLADIPSESLITINNNLKILIKNTYATTI